MEGFVFLADQVDVHLLRCQQLRLYILKAGRALLSHQDKLRQILSQPAVVDIGANPIGETEDNCLNGQRSDAESAHEVLCYLVADFQKLSLTD